MNICMFLNSFSLTLGMDVGDSDEDDEQKNRTTTHHDFNSAGGGWRRARNAAQCGWHDWRHAEIIQDTRDHDAVCTALRRRDAAGVGVARRDRVRAHDERRAAERDQR